MLLTRDRERVLEMRVDLRGIRVRRLQCDLASKAIDFGFPGVIKPAQSAWALAKSDKRWGINDVAPVDRDKTEISMRFSAKRCAYSDMPSFSGHSAI